MTTHLSPDLTGATASASRVELYWIPLGAGTPIVQWNGRAYEALVSRLQGRPPRDVYHSSLIVTVDDGPYTIEMTPVPDGNGSATLQRWTGKKVFAEEWW